MYRHWRLKDGLVETLDPDIHTVHEGECCFPGRGHPADLMQLSNRRPSACPTSPVSDIDHGPPRRKPGVVTNGWTTRLSSKEGQHSARDLSNYMPEKT